MNKRSAEIIEPFIALGRKVEASDICRAIDAMGNVPPKFETKMLAHAILPKESGAVQVERMEALNRLMQRLRKMGLAAYSNKKWHLKRNAWNELQLAVSQFRCPSDQSLPA